MYFIGIVPVSKCKNADEVLACEFNILRSNCLSINSNSSTWVFGAGLGNQGEAGDVELHVCLPAFSRARGSRH